jgi:hypothetical protein
VQWTFPSDIVWVDVAVGDCTYDQFVAGTCQFIVSNRAATSTPQKVLSIPAFPVGMTHTLFMDNRGPDNESISYEIDLVS